MDLNSCKQESALRDPTGGSLHQRPPPWHMQAFTIITIMSSSSIISGTAIITISQKLGQQSTAFGSCQTCGPCMANLTTRGRIIPGAEKGTCQTCGPCMANLTTRGRIIPAMISTYPCFVFLLVEPMLGIFRTFWDARNLHNIRNGSLYYRKGRENWNVETRCFMQFSAFF